MNCQNCQKGVKSGYDTGTVKTASPLRGQLTVTPLKTPRNCQNVLTPPQAASQGHDTPHPPCLSNLFLIFGVCMCGAVAINSRASRIENEHSSFPH